jgi:hypothetical protein
MVFDIIYCIIRVFPHCKAAISALCVISTMNYEFVARIVEMRAAQKPTAVTTNPTENSLHYMLRVRHTTHNIIALGQSL